MLVRKSRVESCAIAKIWVFWLTHHAKMCDISHIPPASTYHTV